MPKKKNNPRKKLFHLFGLDVSFRMRSSEDERNEFPDIDNFLVASIELARKVRTRDVDPLDKMCNLQLLEYLNDWAKYNEELEYISLKFGYLQGLNHIYFVNGNYERQSKALDELLQLIADNKDILHIPDYHRIRLRVAQAYIKAFNERNLLKKADILNTTANYCEKIHGHGYSMDRRLTSLILFIKSQSAKFEAFYYINRPTPDLLTSITKMEEAEMYARKSTFGSSSSDALHKHRAYCSYWLNIFHMRNCILNHDWDNINGHLNSAISSANTFGPSIFPNYYRNITDLSNYVYVINAYQAFSSDEVSEAIISLQEWENVSIDIHGYSWVFTSIKLRRLVLQMVTVHNNLEAREQIFTQMLDLLKHNFLGGASRCLVSLCRQLSQGETSLKDVKDNLVKYFVVEMYVDKENENLIVGDLQTDLSELADRIPLPFSLIFSGYDLTLKADKLDDLLIKYLSIVREYRLIKHNLTQQPLTILTDLLEDFRCGDLTWSDTFLKLLIKYIKTIPNADEIKNKFSIIKNGIIPETFNNLPHIVRVTKLGDNFIELQRCWSDSSCDKLLLFTQDEIQNIYLGKYYYMPTEWNRKRLLRLDLNRGETIPLLPADYYENNLSNIALRYKYYQEFINLLNDPATPESAFRDLVSDNPWMIESGAATFGKEVRTQPVLGNRSGRIDLLAQHKNGLYRIVEFKRPIINIESALSDAAGQCTRYEIDLERHHQGKFTDQIMIVVAGRNDDLTPERRHYLSRLYRSIQLITYDDLQNRIEDSLGFVSNT